MSGTATAALRASLEDERSSLREQLAQLTGGNDFDENFADSSQVAAEQGEVRVLADNIAALLAEVEHALEKLDGSGYGVCEVCGAEITAARLEAMPATRYCVEHA